MNPPERFRIQSGVVFKKIIQGTNVVKEQGAIVKLDIMFVAIIV
jgi:hypothetical protein